MKRIGITQRVVFVERIKERRDVLDQRWFDFAHVLGVILVPVPNNLKEPVRFVEELEIDGLIFSGGNNIGFEGREIIKGKSIEKDDVAYERDKTEIDLIEWATKYKKPIIGVCRGMQILNAYFGGSLSKVNLNQHVGKEHTLEFIDQGFKTLYMDEPIVNSYHKWGITQDELGKSLITLATHEEKEIEAFKHNEASFIGIMWHPERYAKFRKSDLSLFRKVYRINEL